MAIDTTEPGRDKIGGHHRSSSHIWWFSHCNAFRPGAAGAAVRPKGKIRWILSYAALRRRAFRAAGRRDLTAGLRRALPERLAAITLAFTLRTGLVFFFAILSIVVSLPSQIFHCPTNHAT